MKITYDRSEDEWQKTFTDENRKKVAKSWLKKGTLDRWRHNRMLECIIPLIKKDEEWLTIGDGRYGTDANFIISNGGKAHASDVSDTLLRIGSEKGFIKEYSQQNAEKLNFSDESFDYVLIKEALHHLPRPWVAVYEAFRVSRKGVILIEPSDEPILGIRKTCFNYLKNMIKRIRNIEVNNQLYGFEPVGNFVFRINKQEIEKFLLGMHYTNVAFNGLNDYYLEGFEFIPFKGGSKREKKIVNNAKNRINFRNLITSFGFVNYGMLRAILFKQEPQEKLANKLINKKWELRKLPKNPYI